MQAYKVLRLLGEGSFGQAHLAEHRTTRAQVVIKSIAFASLTTLEKDAAKREAELLASLAHPAIVRFIESFYAPTTDSYHLVMAYADSGDLEGLVKERRDRARDGLPEKRIIEIVVQVALACMYLHRKKILHRDIKLANIFCASADDRVLLADFGVSRQLKQTMELAKTVIGTPYFLSPEVCDAQLYHHKSDVWAFGCCVYRLATLKHPFEASTLTTLVRRIKRGTYAPLPPTYSGDLQNLIGAMLQLKPSARPAFQTLLREPFLQGAILEFARKCTLRGEGIPLLELVLTTPSSIPSHLPPVGALLGAAQKSRPSTAAASGGVISSQASFQARPRSVSSTPPSSTTVVAPLPPKVLSPTPPQSAPLLTTAAVASSKPSSITPPPAAAAPAVGYWGSQQRAASPAIRVPVLPVPSWATPPPAASKSSRAAASPAAPQLAPLPPPPALTPTLSEAPSVQRVPVRATHVKPTAASAASPRLDTPTPTPTPALSLTPAVQTRVSTRAPLRQSPPVTPVLREVTSAPSPCEESGGVTTAAAAEVESARLALGEQDLNALADALLPHGLNSEEYKSAGVSVARVLARELERAAEGGAARGADGKYDDDGDADGKCNRDDSEPRSAVSLAATLAPLREAAAAHARHGDFGALNGAALPAAAVGESRDPLHYRIEALRAFLAAALGDAEYKTIHAQVVGTREKMTVEEPLGATVKRALGRVHRPLLPLVYQLVAAEIEMYG